MQGGMSEQGFPVTVSVVREGGRVEEVRIGTAYRQGDSFSLRLGEMMIGPPGSAPDLRAAAAAPRPRSSSSDSSAVFPPYGRSKGQPIAGGSAEDLEYYASGARRSLADASKSRWHDKDRALLAAIEAEQMRQQGGVPPMAPPPRDDDIPPPGDDDIPF